MTRHLVRVTELDVKRVREGLGPTHLSKIAADAFGISKNTFEQQLLEFVRDLRSRFSAEYADYVRESLLAMPVSYLKDLTGSSALALSDGRDFASIADTIAMLDLKQNDEFNEMSDSSEIFDESLATYVSLARRSVIYDPYAADSLFSKKPGRRWLMEKLVRSPIQEIEVHSFVPQSKGAELLRESERVSQTIVEMKSILNLRLKDPAKVVWNFYESDKSKMHRRMMRLYFDRRCIDLQLEKGLDTFASRRIFATYVKELRKPELTPYLHNLPRKIDTIYLT